MADGNFRGHGALVLLSGYPGAGKTTFARALCARTGAAHLESDAIRREIAPQPAYTPAEHGRVFAQVEGRAEALLGAGRPVVVDATNLLGKDRRRFVRLARRLGVPFLAVRLVAPEEEIRRRLRRPRAGASQADGRVFDLMRGRAQPFTVPLVVVDTRFGLEPSLALVQVLLREAHG
ncbi:MAG: ATP-binding protein [Dehalococcoidia bacterium]|nr:ATP-binding protein [Dehalococcoidia bacterium]